MNQLLLAVVFSCLPAFGQAVFSGYGAESGGAQFVVGGGAAALTYSARTDNCVTGAESGCVAGATTGEAGSAMSFLMRNADTAPFSEEGAYGTGPTIQISVLTFIVLATNQTTGAISKRTRQHIAVSVRVRGESIQLN